MTVSATMANSLAGNGVGVAAAVSGAGVVAAGSESEAYFVTSIAGAAYLTQSSATFIMSGLTAGTNTFTLNYRATGGTGYFEQRRITVAGVA